MLCRKVCSKRKSIIKCYAVKLSEKTKTPMIISYKGINDLSDYKTIIHMGGLYAGGVMGLKIQLNHCVKM